MVVDLGCVTIHLTSTSRRVEAEWRRLFADFLVDRQAADIYLQMQAGSGGQYAGWEGCGQTIPASRSLFFDEAARFSVVAPRDGLLVLHFHDGAVVQVPVGGVQPVAISGVIDERVVANGRLEDILYTSLAPALRRRGIVLVHAFGVVKDGRSLLLVGAPGSGKTTAGVALLQSGWALLGNDVILLTEGSDGICAWPTPGYMHIRQPSFELLTALPPFSTRDPLPGADQFLQATNGKWAEMSPVTHLLFPQVTATKPTKLMPLPAAVGLARLMPESMDCWDQATLADHLSLLKRLCTQTAVFVLQSGPNITHLHQLIMAV